MSQRTGQSASGRGSRLRTSVGHGHGPSRVNGIPSCMAGVPIFRVLPTESLEQLGTSTKHRHFDRGEYVAMAGDPVDHLMVVASGRLKLVHSTASGREQVVRTLERGDFLGELALFAPIRHEGDLVSLGPADVCMVPRQSIQAILRRHPDVAVPVVQSLALRLASAEQLIADLGLRDVGQRLAAELLREYPHSVPGPDGSPTVHMSTPWAEVAVRLATTPESLSRRLKALVEEGVIAQEGPRTVVILDVERLRELAEG